MNKLDNFNKEIQKYINDPNKTINKNDVFNFIQNTIEKKLNEKGETLFIFRFQFWSDYKVDEGIRVNSTINQECKTALMIHEYKHFLDATTASYFPFDKEKIDGDVFKIIKTISTTFNDKTKQKLFTDKIKEDEIYKKLFKND